jgi:hypothetical protein
MHKTIRFISDHHEAPAADRKTPSLLGDQRDTYVSRFRLLRTLDQHHIANLLSPAVPLQAFAPESNLRSRKYPLRMSGDVSERLQRTVAQTRVEYP